MAKKRKPGSRVTAKDAFKGTGRALNEEAEDVQQDLGGERVDSLAPLDQRALLAKKVSSLLYTAEFIVVACFLLRKVC